MSTDSRTGSSTYAIDKLTESNYRSWSQQLEWILDEKDLWEVVNGTEQKPVRVTVAGSSTDPTTPPMAADEAAFQERVKEFIAKAKKARSIIGSSILASVMVYIEGMNNPAQHNWRTLETKYNPRTRTTLLQMIRQFMTIKMQDGDDMEKHLQRIQRLKCQCEEQREAISDTVYNGILLNSVPEEFKIAVSILESQETLTPISIINRLLEEWRKLADGASDQGAVAMVMKMVKKKQSGSKPSKKADTSPKASSTEECSHCHK